MSAAATLAGAVPDVVPGWHSINWRKVWHNVRRLQARIVKATQEGRWGKVQALVYLLTHSYSGRAAAILRVTTNAGAATPGVDGDALDQCHKILSRRPAATWILEGDIKACFDRISHDWLLAHIPMDKVILRKWLQAGFMEKDVFVATTEGTPQGGICSPARTCGRSWARSTK
jgi:retron-type reverse transcriptase